MEKFEDLLNEYQSTPVFVDLIKVREIAGKCRKWAENYGKMHKFHKSLAGMCAIATAKLHMELDKKGICSQIAVWEDTQSSQVHCFLLVADHIVDITETQFGANLTTTVAKFSQSCTKKYWKITRQFSAIDDFINYQAGVCWESKGLVNINSLTD